MQKFVDILKVILEYVWLALAVLCVYLFVYEWIKNGLNTALPFLAMLFGALFFFVIRRKRRKSLDAEETHNIKGEN